MFEIILANLISQIPFAIIVVLILYFLLSKRIDSLSRRIDGLSRSIKGLVDVNELMIHLLQGKGIFTESEAMILTKYLRFIIPETSTKYYTKEVRDRLIKILEKLERNWNSLSWEDVFELEKIAELIWKEAEVSGRDDLASFWGKLRGFIAFCKGELIRRKIPPPEKK